MRAERSIVAVCTAIFLMAAPAAGQASWDAPLLIAPGSPAGTGIYLVDPSPGDLGVLVTWRSAPAPVGVGFRAGIGEDQAGDLTLFGGADVSGSIVRRSEPSGFDLIWVTGVGVGASDDLRVTIPGSLVFGWALASDGVVFQPYVGPTAFLDISTAEDDPRDTDLGLALDWGADLEFNGDWTVRIGGPFGDRDALAVGVMLPTGR